MSIQAQELANCDVWLMKGTPPMKDWILVDDRAAPPEGMKQSLAVNLTEDSAVKLAESEAKKRGIEVRFDFGAYDEDWYEDDGIEDDENEEDEF